VVPKTLSGMRFRTNAAACGLQRSAVINYNLGLVSQGHANQNDGGGGGVGSVLGSGSAVP